MNTVIKVDGLSKVFRSRVKTPGLRGALGSIFKPVHAEMCAVDDISFEVERGDILAFIGPNGAGKSTTIKLITGILYPDEGSISVLGMNPHRKRTTLAYRIGAVFGQKSQLWYHLPPSDSFHLLGSIYDVEPGKLKERIASLTETFDIGGFIDTPVRKLSLGQQIRCEIAASLLHEPEILFLDEPSIGLDVVVKQRIRDLILDVNRRLGTTIFLTYHDAGDIEKISRRALVINEGKLVWEGSIKEMKYRLLNRRIIDIKVDGKMKVDFQGVKILKKREYSAKLEIDLSETRLDEVIQRIITGNSIQDITISSTPMEEVISMIYEGVV